jgi:hypothetical protein
MKHAQVHSTWSSDTDLCLHSTPGPHGELPEMQVDVERFIDVEYRSLTTSSGHSMRVF